MFGRKRERFVNHEPRASDLQTFRVFSQTSQVGYYPYKPTESVVYCFYIIIQRTREISVGFTGTITHSRLTNQSACIDLTIIELRTSSLLLARKPRPCRCATFVTQLKCYPPCYRIHSDPSRVLSSPLFVLVCRGNYWGKKKNAWYFYTDISAGWNGNFEGKSGKNVWLRVCSSRCSTRE